MLVTFNPNLTTTKKLHTNCCGCKKVAFGKYELVPEVLVKCPGNVKDLWTAIVAKHVVDSPEVRAKIAKARTLTNDKLTHAYLSRAEEFLSQS